jgi:hypothetical protein
MWEKRNMRREDINWKTKMCLVNNIKMDLGEIGWGGMDWICLSQGRDGSRTLANTVMSPRVPKSFGEF